MPIISEKDIVLPRRDASSHKGQHGRLLIVGGSEDLVGAPVLAALAAFRAGCDIVEVAAPEKVAWAINARDASIITHKVRCSSFSEAQVAEVLRLARPCDAVLVGNGLGRDPAQLRFVRGLLRELEKPVVIDADALHSAYLHEVASDAVVCTPHEKEFRVLREHCEGEPQDRAVILRKGPVDRIMVGEEVYENHAGCPQMAVAGTGDVLAGLVAGFLAQGLSPFRSSLNAAFLNGRAGEAAKEAHGNFTAQELLDFLGADKAF